MGYWLVAIGQVLCMISSWMDGEQTLFLMRC